jgi:hypothetical protein
VVLSELASLDKPIFGEGPRNNFEQYDRIEAKIGRPTQRDCADMNVLFNLRWLLPRGRRGTKEQNIREFLRHAPIEDKNAAADLLARIFVYSPRMRLSAWGACASGFYSRLRDPDARLPNGNPLPPLFDFSTAELEDMATYLPKGTMMSFLKHCGLTD